MKSKTKSIVYNQAFLYWHQHSYTTLVRSFCDLVCILTETLPYGLASLQWCDTVVLWHCIIYGVHSIPYRDVDSQESFLSFPGLGEPILGLNRDSIFHQAPAHLGVLVKLSPPFYLPTQPISERGRSITIAGWYSHSDTHTWSESLLFILPCRPQSDTTTVRSTRSAALHRTGITLKPVATLPLPPRAAARLSTSTAVLNSHTQDHPQHSSVTVTLAETRCHCEGRPDRYGPLMSDSVYMMWSSARSIARPESRDRLCRRLCRVNARVLTQHQHQKLQGRHADVLLSTHPLPTNVKCHC